MIILLIILIFAINVVVLIFVFPKFLKKQNEKREAVKNALGASELKSSKTYSNTLHGNPYKYRYTSKGKNTPSSLSIFFPMSSEGEFETASETATDRFFKKMGISIEIQTGDPLFDDKTYIKSNTIDFTRNYFDDPAKRTICLDINNSGFNHLKHDGKDLVISQTPCTPDKLSRELIEQIIIKGFELTRNVPQTMPGQKIMGVSSWKFKRRLIFGLTILLGIACFGLHIASLALYSPIDKWQIFNYSLKYSLPALALSAWIIIKSLKGRSRSHFDIMGVLISFLFIIPILSYAGTAYYNGAMDNAPHQIRDAMVVHKWYTTNKNSKTYKIKVESWMPDKTTINFRVNRRMYRKITPQSTFMEFTTRPGALNFEWLVSKSIIKSETISDISSPTSAPIVDETRRNQMKKDVHYEYFPDGSIFSQINFTDTARGREGHHRAYHKDGNLWEEFYSLNGLRDGAGRWYYPNGNKKAELTYVQERLNGLNRWYHENGQLKHEQYYLNGQMHGITYEYDEQGNLIKEAMYDNGVLN